MLQLDQVRVKSLVSGLSDAESTQSIAKILFRVCEAFNFKFVSLMVMPAKTDKEISNLILESQHPAGFFAQVDRFGGAEGCLMFDSLRQTTLPFVWTLERLAERYRNLGRDVPPAAYAYSEHDLTMGVAIPLNTVDGSRHVLCFDGNRAAPDRGELCELLMLSMQIFEAYDQARSRANGNKTTLTAREMEVVHWTAAGKTSVEIGMIMELSDHTVNAYMNNAFKKLNCVNRQQLVAKALRLRLIS